jgi:3-dehydroquinate synthase
MKKTKLIVKTKSKNYPIYFGKNILNEVGNLIKKSYPDVKKICVISDNKLPKLLLKNLTSSLKRYNLKILRINASEKNKNFKVANQIIELLLEENFNRSDCVISLGGGIIGDLSAFVSNLTKRGTRFINIPTTLLAQVDASIGGKTGINSIQGKNLIGTFYQPDFVLSDVSILKSLPLRQMVSGYGEILKHALILNNKFFLWLKKNGKKIISGNNDNLLEQAIIRSCKIKNEVVSKDEKENNLRMILNFGHTFAHGFEAAKKFSSALNHGEAVLLGMMVASELSNKMNMLPLEELVLLKKHYLDLNLPMNIKEKFKKNEVNKIVSFMKNDKKNTNERINLILLKKIGLTTKPKKISLRDKQIKEIFNLYY